jgi:hypothetical protein
LFCHFSRDRDAAARKREHENVRPICTRAESLAKTLPGVDSVAKYHCFRRELARRLTNSRGSAALAGIGQVSGESYPTEMIP